MTSHSISIWIVVILLVNLSVAVLGNNSDTNDNTNSSSSSSPIVSLLSFMVGIFLISFAFPIVLWNEGMHVHRLKTLTHVLTMLYMRGVSPSDTHSTVPLDEESSQVKISKKRNDRDGGGGDETLAYVTNVLKSDEDELVDPTFLISVPGACRLRRTVEMYQMVPRRSQSSDFPEATVYDYVWSPEEPYYAQLSEPDDSGTAVNGGNVGIISVADTTALLSDSQSFLLPFVSSIIESSQLRLGAYRLTPSQVDRLGNWRSLRLDPSIVTRIPAVTLQKARYQPTIEKRNTLFFGSGTLHRPNLGDVRVRFSYVPSALYTIIAQERADEFETYYTHKLGHYRLPSYCCFGFCLDTLSMNDSSVDFLWRGRLTPEEVILKESAANRSMVLLLRMIGCSLMVLSIYLLMEPVSAVFGMHPFYVAMVRLGSFLSALCLGVVLTLFIVAVAWYDYNSVVSFGLVTLGACLIIMLLSVSHQQGTAADVVVPGASANS